MFKLSDMIRTPKVKEAFQRAERDNGAAFAVPAPIAPVLTGGAARVLEAA